MAVYKSELTGVKYIGLKSMLFNKHTNMTQFFIGEALVMECSGVFQENEADEYFGEYFKEV